MPVTVTVSCPCEDKGKQLWLIQDVLTIIINVKTETGGRQQTGCCSRRRPGLQIRPLYAVDGVYSTIGALLGQYCNIHPVKYSRVDEAGWWWNTKAGRSVFRMVAWGCQPLFLFRPGLRTSIASVASVARCLLTRSWSWSHYIRPWTWMTPLIRLSKYNS